MSIGSTTNYYPSARSAVQVAALPLAALVEIEVVALGEWSDHE